MWSLNLFAWRAEVNHSCTNKASGQKSFDLGVKGVTYFPKLDIIENPKKKRTHNHHTMHIFSQNYNNKMKIMWNICKTTNFIKVVYYLEY